ncbi:MAG TPA: ABC transporter substrate-binding protein [Acetobacteraceae bacterium]|nr:ABC transporter substrate-binding protein [Acetobacteraceae bacterium]
MSASASRHGQSTPHRVAAPFTRRSLFTLAAAGIGQGGAANAASRDQLTYGVHVSLAPGWFDPGEAAGIITPYMLLYALHDAVVKAMPGDTQTPSLAESHTVSEDGLVHDFILRRASFHNGEPVTSDDVRFSFERYRGASQSLLKQRVAAVETPDPQRIRFRLKEPWPDFLTFYAGVSGAAWIVPHKYLAQVGDESFKKAPIGAGPYRFVSFTPGVELVLEAFDGYWRQPPKVKRLVMKVIPDEATRLAALKRGEIDIAYSIRGELAGELEQTPGLSIKAVIVQGVFCVYFVDQWDAKSPWHEVRVRQAAKLAIDCKTINDALTRGYSHVTGNPFVPDMFEFYWQPPAPVYDPAQAKQLLAAAGYPNGFDAGFYNCDSSYSNIAEAVINYWGEVGIRIKMRPMERAAYIKAFAEKQYRNVVQAGPAAFGNAATRLESHAVTGGTFTYGSYPELDELFRRQAGELDYRRREELLHQMQQVVHDRAIYAPIWQLAFLNGIGPRVAESGFGRIAGFPYTAPYDELALKVG